MSKIENFGLYLRHERELRGIPLEEIANATKIHMRFLNALEDNHYDELPGEVFIKGYIRAYAKSIGADIEETLAVYDECVGKLRAENIKKINSENEKKRLKKQSFRRNMVAGIFLIGAVLAGFYAVDKTNERHARVQRAAMDRPADVERESPEAVENQPPVSTGAPIDEAANEKPDQANALSAGETAKTGATEPGNETDAARAGSSAAVAEEKTVVAPKKNDIIPPASPARELEKPKPGAPPVSTSPEKDQKDRVAALPLQLTIRTKDNSWFNMTVDGAREMDFILPAGTTKAFPGKESFKITIGNKNAVELILNGRVLALPPSADNVVRDFQITQKLLE